MDLHKHVVRTHAELRYQQTVVGGQILASLSVILEMSPTWKIS